MAEKIDNDNDGGNERDISKNESDTSDDGITAELEAEFSDIVKKDDDENDTLIERPEKEDEKEPLTKEDKKPEKREEPEKEQPEVAKELVTDAQDYKKDYEELKRRHEALEKTVASLKPKEVVIDPKDAVAAVTKSVDIKIPETKEPIIDLPPIDSEKLARFLSGDPEQAMPVLKEFVSAAAFAVGQYIVQKNENERQVTEYAEKANQRFYELNEDLAEYKDVVSQAYAVVIAKNPTKWPHELFNDIASLAKRTIDYIAEKKGVAYQPIVTTSDNEIKTVHRTVEHKGGAINPGVRPTSVSNKLTEQEKEMFELIDPELDHTKIQ